MTSLLIENLTKKFGQTTAVDALDLAIGDSELVALLGPSGCGKTTLLRIIAGFVEATSGSVKIGNRDITSLPPNKRNTGMIFQSYALFPHMTVAENVSFGLEMRKIPKIERKHLITEALKLVHLQDCFDRNPKQLSGGQQQRVAIARALVTRPDILLLDEPLSNLDAVLRESVGHEIRALQKRLKLTSVFVTHDQKEALMLADRIVVMNAGRIIQTGKGPEVYSRPNSRFVANFLGKSNFFKGNMTSQGMFNSTGGLHIKANPQSKAGRPFSLMIVRPESIKLGPASTGLNNCFEGTISRVTYLGSLTEVELKISDKDSVTAQIQNVPGTPFSAERGEKIRLGWESNSTHLLNE